MSRVAWLFALGISNGSLWFQVDQSERVVTENAPSKPKLTIPELAVRKAAGERLVMVAVGEAMSAAWAARAGVDIMTALA